MFKKEDIKIVKKSNGPIKPVSFINGEDQYTDDVNHLFTLPYELSTVDDFAKITGFEKLKRNSKNIDDLMDQAIEIEYRSTMAIGAALNAYVAMNLCNLVNDALLRFMNYMFGSSIKDINDFASVGYGVGLMDININDIIIHSVNSRLKISSIYCTYPRETLAAILVGANDAILTDITVEILDPFIRNLVIARADAIPSFYKIIYNVVYGEDPKTEPDLHTMYNFCSSCLRERMETIYHELAGSMQLMVLTEMNMIYNHIDYFQPHRIGDKKYTIKNVIEDYPYLTSSENGLITEKALNMTEQFIEDNNERH